MDADEMKDKLSLIAHDLGTVLPYEPDELPDDWESLSDALADLASVVARYANSIAAYSAIAKRKANKG